jgi:hypothetical protein
VTSAFFAASDSIDRRSMSVCAPRSRKKGLMLKDIVDRVLRQELVGERVDRREWLWHRLWELDRTKERAAAPLRSPV